MSTTALRYRVPSIQPEVEVCAVTLRDFDIDEIREYLDRHDSNTLDAPAEERPTTSPYQGSLVIQVDDLNRIETLALCGQTEHARQHALRLISDHIGRPL